MSPDPRAIEAIAKRQFEVVTRTQLLAAGATPTWISQRVRSGRWQRLFPRTYVVHNGPAAWRTRARAALGYTGDDAVLSHRSAAFVHEFISEPPGVLEIAVDHRRRVREQPGLVVRRSRIERRGRGRLRATDRATTVLDLIASATAKDDVVGIVCAAIRAGTRPEEIRRTLAGRPKVRHRTSLLELLGEVADGVESPLEHRYHHDVERRHGLPRSRPQVRQRLPDGWIRADAIYEDMGVRTELDGALAHPRGRTDADTWRDNAVLIARGEITLRYRWQHVAAGPCAVALQVEAALRSRGWPGRARPCGPGCAVAHGGRATPGDA